ncbi:hypothetical protein FRAAL6848 [Frankia alni ACN14a]|uniref:Uncharacterized protein n=1 Tax=Frankia alni (strain DSM 45986 / CECT 9034 / ACN14a) TaxID=326424 RepID=Q0RAR9_FRAAA|nr:hypothetical protein FRAAL6848 [Frankia alni ACN14a]
MGLWITFWWGCSSIRMVGPSTLGQPDSPGQLNGRSPVPGSRGGRRVGRGVTGVDEWPRSAGRGGVAR